MSGAPQRQPPSTAPATVLVIDDDQRFADELVETLSNSGFSSFSCNAASDALVAARRRHPDVILLDINLGGVDGYQVMDLLRQDEKLADVPVIAISAYFERRPYDAIGKHYRIHSFLGKPFHPHQIIASIQRALAEPGREGSLPGE